MKPVPLMVTAVPPAVDPLTGAIDVTVTVGAAAVTLTLADFASLQVAAVVTVTLIVSVPTAPAVNVMLLVPVPAGVVPVATIPSYGAPGPRIPKKPPFAGRAGAAPAGGG